MTQVVEAHAVPVPSSVVLPVGNPREVIHRGHEAAQALLDVVQRNRTKLEVRIGPGTHLRLEAWQTVGAFFGLVPQTESVVPIEREGQVVGYRARVVLRSLLTGETVSAAESMCTRDEPTWQSKPDFQLQSMAQTRAASKALRLALAWVIVLAGYEPTPAEEVEEKSPPTAETSKPTARPQKPAENHPDSTARFKAWLEANRIPFDQAKQVWQVLWPRIERWKDLSPAQQEYVANTAPYLYKLAGKFNRHELEALLPEDETPPIELIKQLAEKSDAFEPVEDVP